jgi:hypothetical protein
VVLVILSGTFVITDAHHSRSFNPRGRISQPADHTCEGVATMIGDDLPLALSYAELQQTPCPPGHKPFRVSSTFQDAFVYAKDANAAIVVVRRSLGDEVFPLDDDAQPVCHRCAVDRIISRMTRAERRAVGELLTSQSARQTTVAC